MDPSQVLAWAQVAEVAISVGVATEQSVKGLISRAAQVQDDDPVLDSILSEATRRQVARQAEADNSQ